MVTANITVNFVAGVFNYKTEISLSTITYPHPQHVAWVCPNLHYIHSTAIYTDHKDFRKLKGNIDIV